MVTAFQAKSNRELLAKAAEGDQKSLEFLLAGYSGYLNVLSRGQLAKEIRHRVSPSDVIQETLLEAHRDFHRFQGTDIEAFTAWLRKVLVNNIASAVETHLVAAKRSIRREHSLNQLSASVELSHSRFSAMEISPHRSPASELDHEQSLFDLAAAIELLPDDYRTVITMRHLDGDSFTEIASLMKRSTGAVRMLWLRAIEQLRKTLEQP